MFTFTCIALSILVGRGDIATSYWSFDEIENGTEHNEAAPTQRMCLELARNFMSIQDKSQQEALSQMARVLAEDPELQSA